MPPTEEEKKDSDFFDTAEDESAATNSAADGQTPTDILNSGAAMMLAADPRLGQSTIETVIVPDMKVKN